MLLAATLPIGCHQWQVFAIEQGNRGVHDFRFGAFEGRGGIPFTGVELVPVFEWRL